jgi:hypothetical protein
VPSKRLPAHRGKQKRSLDEAMRGLLTEVARIGAAEWARFLAEQTADNGAPPESEEKPAKAKRPRRRHDSPK